MPPRPLFPSSADTPVRLRMALGWGLFFLFLLAGLWLFWLEGASVPTLIEAVRA